MNRGTRWGRGAALVMGLALAAPVRAAEPAALDLQRSVIDVAERLKPAVVSITTERSAPAAETPVPLPIPPGRQFGTARGSGVIYRETEGHYFILTNAHVVRGARRSQVRVQIIAEREERDGEVVGFDTRTDTGVVKIGKRPDDKLAVAQVGRATDLRAGSFVLAIGSPFGFEWSVSFGVVSGLERELDEPMTDAQAGRPPTRYRGLIQTDASINPGNSGGPLVDLLGRVVGINFAIYSPGAAGNVGVGFAIPIDRASRAADDIIAYGRVKRGYLGVMVSDVDAAANEQRVPLEQFRNLLGTDSGAYVSQVNPGTPAARAGLERNDVIVGVNGEPVENSGALVDRVSATAPETELTLDVVRAGERRQLKVVVGELPADAGGQPEQTPPRPQRDPLGLRVAPLTEPRARELGVQMPGVVVEEVQPNGLGATRLGLRQGAVLEAGRMAGGARVEFADVETYQRFVQEAAEKNALVVLWFSVPGERNQPRQMQSRVVQIPRPAGEDAEPPAERD